MVDIAALLNAAAAKLKINPSAIQEGTPASAIWGSRFNDDPNAKVLSHSKLLPTRMK